MSNQQPAARLMRSGCLLMLLSVLGPLALLVALTIIAVVLDAVGVL